MLIIGHGFVGKAVDYGFNHPDLEKTIIDPKYGNSLDDVDVTRYSIAFVCVPTPFGDDGSIDDSILCDVIRKLGNNITIVIKSTVIPAFFDKFDNYDIVYNPEFLTEKSANEDFIRPEFHVFGGLRFNTDFLERFYEEYSLCTPCPVYHMTQKEASFVKYGVNSFLAMKVTFFNQLYDAIGREGETFNNYLKAFKHFYGDDEPEDEIRTDNDITTDSSLQIDATN
jgi:UDPglucose 6-dehydrogenase